MFVVELTNVKYEVITLDSGAGRARVATGPVPGRHHDAKEGGSPHVCRQRDPHHELQLAADHIPWDCYG